ncbi:hypothetical protein, partial [Escherichia coli]
GSENRINIIKENFIFFICKLLMGCVIESLFVIGFDIVFYQDQQDDTKSVFYVWCLSLFKRILYAK